MKLARQFLLIAAFSFLGEGMKALIPAPIPASVYGLVALLIALFSGAVKTAQIKEASKFLIEAMPVMFIPAAVGLLTAWEALRPVLLPVGAITVISTVVVMLVSGHVTQAMIRLDKKAKK